MQCVRSDPLSIFKLYITLCKSIFTLVYIEQALMSATGQDEHTSSHEAGCTNSSSSKPMPQDVLRLIISLLPASDLPGLRLVCQDMARAVDHTVTALNITRWPSKGSIATGFKRLQSVTSINITGRPEWDHIEKLACNMQQLSRLSIPYRVNSRMPASCAASLTALTRLDLGTNSPQTPIVPLPKRGSVQLPALEAASFNSKHSKAGAAGNGTLADIAAFAPNLEQLYCMALELHPKEAAKLPRCTHFGALEVNIVGASSKAAGGAALPAAFPRLRAFSCIPDTIKIHAEQKHYGKWTLSPSELLTLCKSATAVRGFGPHVARSIGAAAQKGSGQLQQLKALSVRAGMASSTNFLGIGALKGLQQLELIFDAPLSRHGPSPSFRASFLRDMQQVLQQLQHLQHLKTLVLPASLLCSSCCNEGFSAAAAHTELLHTLEAAVAQKVGSSSLQDIVFLDVQWPEFCSCFAEGCWAKPQEHQQRVQERFEVFRERQQQREWLQGVVGDEQQQGDQGSLEAQQQKQQQEKVGGLVCELRLGLVCSEGVCLENSTGRGVWGVYGPEEW